VIYLPALAAQADKRSGVLVMRRRRGG